MSSPDKPDYLKKCNCGSFPREKLFNDGKVSYKCSPCGREGESGHTSLEAMQRWNERIPEICSCGCVPVVPVSSSISYRVLCRKCGRTGPLCKSVVSSIAAWNRERNYELRIALLSVEDIIDNVLEDLK